MKRFLLAAISAIILAFILLMNVQTAHAQGITNTCGFTMTYIETSCSYINSGSFESTHDGSQGTQTWASNGNMYSEERCADAFTVTMKPTDQVTLTSWGDFPYYEWSGAQRSPPEFWCHLSSRFSFTEQTDNYAVGVYSADSQDDGDVRCYVGYNTGYVGRHHTSHGATYSWSWAVGFPCVNAETCGPIQDAHMVLDPPASPWHTLIGDTAWHDGSEWNLPYPSRIRQSIVLTEGVYSILIRARTTSLTNNPALHIQLGANVSEVYINSTSLAEYQTIIMSDGGTQELTLQVLKQATNIVVDYVCIILAESCSMPCRMGTYDATISRQYLKNSEMYGLEYPPGLWSVNCTVSGGIPGGLGISCSQHKADTGLNAYYWSGSGANASVSGVKRWSGPGICGQAVGLMPPPLQNGTTQILNMRPSGPYNVALRMKRVYGNSNLTVCGQTVDYTTLGEWADASFYCPNADNSVTLLAGCTGGSCVSHYQGADVGDYSAVEVDDVYIIPGGPISCTVPAIVPTMDCINNNYHLVGLSSRVEMQGANPQTTLEEGWNLSNARMGSLAAGPYAHKARLWPSNGDTFISQYVQANPGSIADSGSIVPGRSYSITVSAMRFDNSDASMDVVVGAQSPGAQTWNIPLNGANASTIWSAGFVATTDMLNGDNMAVRVGNTGGSVLIDNVCISTGGPPITPTHPCIGTWLSSSDGNPYGGPTPAGGYIKNVVDLSGNYWLEIAGIADSATQLTVKYFQPSTNEEIDLSLVYVGSAGIFSSSAFFLAPPTWFSTGELRIHTDQDVTFTYVCLSQYDPPGGPGPGLPGPAPIPECETVTSRIRTPLFYMMSPYSITTEYTETAPAYYASELMYNYAIYPLVCTTISIANWQFDAYNEFKAAYDAMVDQFSDYFQQIIAVLWAIWDKLGQATTPGINFLDLLWQLFMMLIKLLLKLLALVYQVLDLVIKMLKDVSLNSKSGLATTYPITCVGDAQWMCLGLAAIMAADRMAGQWIRLVALLAVGCLTIGLIFWLSGQIRNLLQPGDSGTSA